MLSTGQEATKELATLHRGANVLGVGPLSLLSLLNFLEILNLYIRSGLVQPHNFGAALPRR